ncbi:DUF1830 domain-containing protein [Acaryochloris sp. IP29b_bin.148]|uniref:DUF1830 domain-containing protein n=1 Tax=Acaryochloris sp. IP29b_bin.148 TaxID=2969218 RepID=UPI002608210C|nr:DUF1830 domain-containing protein [Acaryochloris sp. IP29b_bin.148]
MKTLIRRTEKQRSEEAANNNVSCSYVNKTQAIQVVRVVTLPHQFLERTLLPSQQLQFEAPPFAELEVYTYENATAILSAKILCASLQKDHGYHWVPPTSSLWVEAISSDSPVDCMQRTSCFSAPKK